MRSQKKQEEEIEKLKSKVNILEQQIFAIASAIDILDSDISLHKTSLEKIYEVNIKLLSILSPKLKELKNDSTTIGKNKEKLN